MRTTGDGRLQVRRTNRIRAAIASLASALLCALAFTITSTLPTPEHPCDELFARISVPLAFNCEGFATAGDWSIEVRQYREAAREGLRETGGLTKAHPNLDWRWVGNRMASIERDIDHAFSIQKISEAVSDTSTLKADVSRRNAEYEEVASRVVSIREKTRAAIEWDRKRQEEISAEREKAVQEEAAAQLEAPDYSEYTDVYIGDNLVEPIEPIEAHDEILDGLEFWFHWNQNEPNWGDYTDQGWWNGCAGVSEAMVLSSYSGNAAYTPDWMSRNGLLTGHSMPYYYGWTADGDIANVTSKASDYVNENPGVFHLAAHWDASFRNQGDFETIRRVCDAGGCAHVRVNPNVMPMAFPDSYSPTGIHSVVIVRVLGNRVVIADPGQSEFTISTVDEVTNAFRIKNAQGDVCYGHFWELFERIE